MTQADETATDEQGGFGHYGMLSIDGLYDGLIAVASTPGLIVDAVNQAPRILNILPGEQGFTAFSDDPFLGSAQIHDGLTSLHHGYNDVAGVVVPERETTLDNLAYGAGYVGGAVITTAGVGVATTALTAPATGLPLAAQSSFLSTPAGSAVNAATNAVTSTVSGGLRGSWWAVTHPMQATFAATAVGGTASAIDIAANEGRLTSEAAEAVVTGAVDLVASGADALAERFIGSSISEAFNNHAPDWMQDTFESIVEAARENPEIAQWGSLGAAFLISNALLGGFAGDSIMGQIVALAVSAFIAWGVGEFVEGQLSGENDDAPTTPDILPDASQEEAPMQEFLPEITPRGFAPA